MTVKGAALATKIFGHNGNDVITGQSAVDILRGNKGNDVLNGAGGDDKLRGGGGSDTMVRTRFMQALEMIRSRVRPEVTRLMATTGPIFCSVS